MKLIKPDIFRSYVGHCPSADDPLTTAIETDCSNVLAANSNHTGASGNKCQVDCANRGLCDYATGKCNCFDGFYGTACTLQNVLARSNLG